MVITKRREREGGGGGGGGAGGLFGSVDGSHIGCKEKMSLPKKGNILDQQTGHIIIGYNEKI